MTVFVLTSFILDKPILSDCKIPNFNIIKKHKPRQLYHKTQQLVNKHTKNNSKRGPGQMGVRMTRQKELRLATAAICYIIKKIFKGVKCLLVYFGLFLDLPSLAP